MRRHRKVKRAAALLLACLPILLIALWMTFQHKPRWYRPALLDAAGLERARGEATTMADSISRDMVQGRPFDIILQARRLNDWVGLLPELFPEQADLLPPQLSRLAIGFGDGKVHVGAFYESNGWRVILSVSGTVQVQDGGRTLRLALADVSGGSLPVPRVWLDRFLRPLLHRTRTAWRDETTDGASSAHRIARDLRSVDDLFEGIEIRNRFVWPNGHRPFRIESVRVEEGGVRLRIHPL